MECNAPPPLTEDQLSAAADGVEDATVRSHLASCPSCAARLDAARQAERRLHAALLRWDCPAPAELADYHVRRLAPAQAREVEQHLAGCARCTAELADLRAFMAADLLEAAPPPARMPSGSAPWSVLFARPVSSPAAVALRGAGSGPLMLAAAGATIFLDAQPAGAGLISLQGQLVASDEQSWTGALVEVRHSGALAASAEVDELGSFACAAFPAGQTELRISLPSGRMLVLSDLDLSAR